MTMLFYWLPKLFRISSIVTFPSLFWRNLLEVFYVHLFKLKSENLKECELFKNAYIKITHDQIDNACRKDIIYLFFFDQIK